MNARERAELVFEGVEGASSAENAVLFIERAISEAVQAERERILGEVDSLAEELPESAQVVCTQIHSIVSRPSRSQPTTSDVERVAEGMKGWPEDAADQDD